ncbi:protein Shroom3 isoform X4 [Hemitrygon akajei]|uniref:protein Shroom3 isoform X4 n=1 Tax=Hemitrygon akajei TaxID=2704970 RepID=UPI003BF998F5
MHSSVYRARAEKQKGRLNCMNVEVFLRGGAPWGFTLKGGLEHGEPLIISKIEEGGKADLLTSKLQVGDEVVNINDVELSGYRQEAITLVKGSYKSLKLLIRRRTEPTARPHSWHSAKLAENQPDSSMMQISQGTISTPWHQTYHSSSSTSDLSGYDHGYLRRSPDQYSSRGSMESLDHTNLPYHSCNLSPAKSTNSIDQLSHHHSKRDSAYSSFSTSSSIPEYPAPTLRNERSYSMENMPSRNSLHEGIRQADIKYVKTVYDSHRGISEEREVSCPSAIKNSNGRSQTDPRSYYKPYRHSIGPVWNNPSRNFLELDNKAPPLPPTRSDSFMAIKSHDKPTSWSGLDGQSKPTRPQQKGVWLLPTNSGSSGQKPLFAEGQLNTVMEKSPESSPITQPKHGYIQTPQPGQPMLPTGIYPVPQPEPRYAQAPTNNSNFMLQSNNNGLLCPALSRENTLSAQNSTERTKCAPCNVEESIGSKSGLSQPNAAFDSGNKYEMVPEQTQGQYSHYKVHVFADSDPVLPDVGYKSSPSMPSGVSASTVDAQYSFGNSEQAQGQQTRKNNEKGFSVQHTESWQGRCQMDGESYQWKAEQENRAPWVQIGDRQSSPFWQSQTETKMTSQWESYSENRLSQKLDYDRKEQASDHWGSYEKQMGPKRYSEVSNTVQPKFQEQSSCQEQQGRPESGRSRYSSSSIQSSQSRQFTKPEITKRSSVLEAVNMIEQREHDERVPNARGVFSARLSQSSSSRNSLNNLDDILSRVTDPQPSRQPAAPMMNLITADKTPILHHLTCESRDESIRLEDPRRQDRDLHLPAKAAQRNDRAPIPIANKGPQLHKSRSSLQLMEKGERDTLWEDDISGSPPDNAFNRAYRNSLKDAQSKVLRATSFRRKDLDLTPPYLNKPKALDRPASAHVGSASQVRLLQAPRERHCMTPTEERQATAEVHAGPQVARIGSRKRLTAEQKKRSYSEPEKLNELGVSDPQQKNRTFTLPEATELRSVADRRRLFERDARTMSTVNLSRPELKQLQQNALADYMHRKTGRRPQLAEQLTPAARERSHSVYLQPSRDVCSLSSCSSLSSLCEVSPTGSSQPPGPASLPTQPRAGGDRHYGSELTLNRMPPPPDAGRVSRLSRQASGQQPPPSPFDRQSSARNSGKFASADNLLERADNPVIHTRSRSSPSTQMVSQDILNAVNRPPGFPEKDLNSSSKTMGADCTSNWAPLAPGSRVQVSRPQQPVQTASQDRFSVNDSTKVKVAVINGAVKNLQAIPHYSCSAQHNDDVDPLSTLTTREESKHHQSQRRDASCVQMQNTATSQENSDCKYASVSLEVNEKSPEDLKSEELAKQIIGEDKSLAEILDPDSNMKTTMDLMEGIFPRGSTVRQEAQHRRPRLQEMANKSASQEDEKGEKERGAASAHCPTYYSTSAQKAELMNKIRDMHGNNAEDEKEEVLDINEKKTELIESITRKIQTLREAKESLASDIKLNGALGDEVETIIKDLCKSNEFEKYKMFIGDLDKVVNLLLSLSGRLARVENVLKTLDENANTEERNMLNEKRRLLASQHEDAKELKENLDRRAGVVLDILENYLTAEQLEDYQHFVKMKAALLMEQRELDDKIKLGEEQLRCLLESLPADFVSQRTAPSPISHSQPSTSLQKFTSSL